MQKIVDLENTSIGILKPYSNFESCMQYLVVNALKKKKKNLVNWKNSVKTNILCENQTFKM